MSLTVQEIKNLSCPDGKSQIKRSDGNNLFLLVKSGGASFGDLGLGMLASTKKWL